jgi:hypothetical protein
VDNNHSDRKFSCANDENPEATDLTFGVWTGQARSRWEGYRKHWLTSNGYVIASAGGKGLIARNPEYCLILDALDGNGHVKQCHY